VDVISILRTVVKRSLLGFIVVLSLLATPAFAVEYQDSQIFISGFNAYQSKNYPGAIENMSQLLKKYPDSPLRDMAIFWLARANYKAGHRKEAAQYMAQFYKEYPNSPLKNTVEPELAKLAAAYAKGEPLPAEASPPEEKVVTASAAETKQAAEKADAERLAAEKAFAEKAESERAAAAKTAAQETTGEKHKADEKAAAETAWQERVAAEKAAEGKTAAAKKAPEKVSKAKRPVTAKAAPPSQSAAMRAKAIAGYKSVIARYPGSRAAAVAKTKLKELGVASSRPGVTTAASGANSQIMSLEIEQFADCELNLPPGEAGYPAGRRFSIPFDLVNRGNAPDSFALESQFPTDYDSRFVSASSPDSTVTITPQLVAGETFKGMLTGIIPRNSIDGEQVAFPIKAVSQYAADVSQSKEISMVVSAPLLRAVINPDRATVLPGENVVYHIALLNAGTADAGKLTFNLDYSPHYEPVDLASSGFQQGAQASLTIEGLKIHSGESRDFTVLFKVKGGAPAHSGLSVRANVVNNELESRESFFSAATVVQEISGVAVRSNTQRLVVIPGQTMTVPIVVTNTGNIRESLRIASDATNGVTCRYYQDLQRSGRRAPDAMAVTSVGPLEPQEEAYLIMEMTTPSGIADGSEILVGTTVEPENKKIQAASVSVSLWFSRPIVELATSASGGKLKPAEFSSYEFSVANRGSNIAKTVEIRSILPENLEILAADVPFVQGGNGEYLWNFPELGAGEKRVVKVSFRVRTGIPVGTNIQIKNLVTYEDQLGNRY
jgi:hypothetical protein